MCLRPLILNLSTFLLFKTKTNERERETEKSLNKEIKSNFQLDSSLIQ